MQLAGFPTDSTAPTAYKSDSTHKIAWSPPRNRKGKAAPALFPDCFVALADWLRSHGSYPTFAGRKLFCRCAVKQRGYTLLRRLPLGESVNFPSLQTSARRLIPGGFSSLLQKATPPGSKSQRGGASADLWSSPPWCGYRDRVESRRRCPA